MELHAEHSGDTSIIIIDKDKLIGIENETFQTLVQSSIDRGSKNISVDLSNVKFIASWGIGSLVHAYTTCNNKQVKFSIKDANASVMNVLNNLKLTMLFNII
jgi:anti-anti-sigma factor